MRIDCVNEPPRALLPSTATFVPAGAANESRSGLPGTQRATYVWTLGPKDGYRPGAPVTLRDAGAEAAVPDRSSASPATPNATIRRRMREDPKRGSPVRAPR